MDRHIISATGKLAIGVGGVALGLFAALLDTFRELFFSAGIERADERRLHDSDLMGEYNHRTGRLDAGFDPYGWYDEN